MADSNEKKAEDKEEPKEAADLKAGAEEPAQEEKSDAGAKPAEKKAASRKPAAGKAAAAKAEAKKTEPKKTASKPRKKAAPAKSAVNVPAVKTVEVRDAGLSPEVFEVEPKIGVLHEVVRAEMAALRQGSASTKNRSEVRGGGAKPWRQKGTGRARAGSSRMPHWTGGGVAFGPKPRDYTVKVNRKVRCQALRMALSVRVREGGLKVVDNLSFPEPNTAAAAAVLGALDVTYPLLVLVDEKETNAILAFRNLPQVGVTVASELDVGDIMGARTVLTTPGVVEKLNARLGIK